MQEVVMLGKIFGKRESKKVPKDHGSPLAQKMTEMVHCPAQYFPAGTDKEVITIYYRYSLIKGKRKGYTPVLVPVDKRLAEFWEICFSNGFDSKKILGSASSDTGKKVLEVRYKEAERDYVNEYEEPAENLIGKYFGTPQRIRAFSGFSQGDQGTQETILFEVPPERPWEVFAFLPFGGWNDCPDPEDVISISKYWYEQYGAVPSVLALSTLEMMVPECISQEASLDLAKEHYAFCPDRVDQCTKTQMVSELAACLSVSDIWYFWWD